MATASVTYTFVNDTPAEAAEVNQNFIDLVTFANDNTVHTDGSKAMTAALSMGSNKITGLATPTASTDAATKGYVDSAADAVLPVGMVSPYAGSSAPSGWLLCDGSAVSRSTYADLFNVVGTTYGAGNGSTTFNVPNLKGKVPVGRDSADTSFDALGETGGAKTHTLTEAQLPSHDHSINHGHSDTFAADQSSHDHSLDNATLVVRNDGAGNAYLLAGSQGLSVYGPYNTYTIDSNPSDPAITVSGSVTNHTGNSGTAGSGSSHNILQPYIVLNYIIKV